MAVDASGHVFVADSDNERIQEFNATGTTLIATYGDKTPANGGSGDFFQLRRVAVANGQVYGADLWGLHIDRFTAPGPTPAQTYPAMFSAPPQGFFNEPSGMTFDNAGNLYVADSVNQRIQQFTPGADGATWAKGAMWGARGWGASDLSGFNWPRDVSFAPSTNTLWVADTKNNRLLEFKTDGTSTGNSIIVGGALTWPYAVDASGGSLIVADTFANKVESWTGSTVNWSASMANGIALQAPLDVAVADGIVYVADAANKRIVELNANTGAYIATVGPGYLHSPQGVAIDPSNGNIWVSDTSFNKPGRVPPAAGGAPIQTVSAPRTVPSTTRRTSTCTWTPRAMPTCTWLTSTTTARDPQPEREQLAAVTSRRCHCSDGQARVNGGADLRPTGRVWSPCSAAMAGSCGVP